MTIFNTADLAIVTKIDLAEAVGFNRQLLRQNIERVRAGLCVLETSARTGQGLSSAAVVLAEAREREGAERQPEIA